MNPLKLKSGFLSHIAGLRGLAVALVVVSHLGVPGFANGFIGVDIFFVISGFLITGIMAKEYEQNRVANSGFGWISLKHFYFRRAKRILPASLAVSATILIYSLSTQNVFAFGKVLKDFWWATFFGANINFLQQSTDYFQQTQSASPFQHYWSLSIEEQFYFVWPTVFLLAVSFNALHIGSHWITWRQRAIGLIGALTFASLAWMVYDFTVNPHDAYFSLGARGWELGLGSLTALAIPYLRISQKVRTSVSVLALILIALSVIVVTPSNFGYLMFMPAFAAAGFVALGDSLAFKVNPLKWQPFTFLGNISYSLYLWHWPFITFATTLGAVTPVSGSILLLASLVIATATYVLIEQPALMLKAPASWALRDSLRQDKLQRPYRAVKATIAATLVLTFCGGIQLALITVQNNVVPALTPRANSTKLSFSFSQSSSHSYSALDKWQTKIRQSAVHISQQRLDNAERQSLQKYLSAGGQTWYDDSRWGCSKPVPNSILKRCSAGNPTAPIKIVMIGDSHAEMFGGALQAIASSRHDIHVVAWIHQQCPNSLYASGIRTAQEVTDVGLIKTCNYFHAHLRQLARKDLKSAHVLLADFAPKNLGAYQLGNIALLKSLKSVAGSVATIGSSPTYPALFSCMGKQLDNASKCGGSQTQGANYLALDSDKTNTDFLPTAKWFCYVTVCPVFIDKTLVTVDGGHITNDLSQKLAPLLLEALAL